MLELTTMIDLTCFCFFYFEADNLPSRKFCQVMTICQVVNYIVTKTRICYFIPVSAEFYLYFWFLTF